MNDNEETVVPKGVKLIFGALVGWLGAWIMIYVICGKNGFIGGAGDVFLALAPGVLIGMYIVNSMSKSSNPEVIASNKANTSFTEQILQLKQLLDAGAITQEEFDNLKKKIIGGELLSENDAPTISSNTEEKKNTNINDALGI